MSTDAPPRRRRALRRFIVVIAVLVVLVSAGVIWDKQVKDNVLPRRWGVVEEGIVYRSGELSPRVVARTWEKNDIDVVIKLSGHDQDDREADQAALAAARDLGIERHTYSLRGDGTGDLDEYTEAMATLIQSTRADKRTVIHCASGVYRTGALVAFYRMLVQGRSGTEVYQELAGNGVEVDTDPPLIPFLNESLPTIAERLHAAGLIDEIPEPLPVVRPGE